MPRHAPRLARAWGTRYDALPDSSSVASEESEKDASREPTIYTDPHSETRSEVSSTVNKPPEGIGSFPEDGPRVGSEKPISLESSAKSPDADVPIAEQTLGYRHQFHQRPLPRWNHNASVFVASLPPVPNAELDELLRDTLGKHGSIINIKFIHDVKSGHSANCAFVQFETPREAANAIQACHMSFIKGRCIRCEPAKAHRTLLVSFRPHAPIGRAKLHQDAGGSMPQDHVEWVRFRRPEPRSRYVQVTYNDEARNFSLGDGQLQWVEDPLQGSGVLISLNQDVSRAATMKALTEVFGLLEFFQCFRVPTSEEARGHPYAPHPPSTPEQAQGENALTWEVKWEQRNDAVSATLSQLPNLIVTWAHEHPHPSHYQNRPWIVYAPDHQGSDGNIQSPSKLNGPTVSSLSPSQSSIVTIVSLPGSKTRQPAPVLNDFPPLPGTAEGNGERKRPLGDVTKGSWKGFKPGNTEVTTSPLKGDGRVFQSNSASAVDYHDSSLEDFSEESKGMEIPASSSHSVRFSSSNVPPETPVSLTHSLLPTPSTVALVTPSPSANLQQLPSDSLFIGGLDRAYGWTDVGILEVFSKYGKVELIKIIFKTHTGPGHAFLKYADSSSMQAAIDAENGNVYGGTVLRVKYSSTNPNRGRGTYWRRTHNVQGLGLEGISDKEKYISSTSSPLEATSAQFAIEVDSARPVVIVSQELHPISPPHTPASSDIEVLEEASPTKSNVPLREAPLLVPNDAYDPPTSRATSPDRDARQAMHRPTHFFNRRRSRAKSDPATPSVGFRNALPAESPTSTNPKQSLSASRAMSTTMLTPASPAPFINTDMNPISGHSSQPWKQPFVPVAQSSFFPAFIPYMSSVETGSSSQQGVSTSSLPPLQPTGFVQNEQGMLIPLYRNEALNHYLATTSTRPQGETGVTYWNSPPAWQAPPPWLPQQAITPASPATQSNQVGYTHEVESTSRSPNHQHHSSVSSHPHHISPVPMTTQYLTPKLEPAQPSATVTNTQATSNQTPNRGRARNNPHNAKPNRNVHNPHNTVSDTRASGHGPTFQQLAENKLVHPNPTPGHPLSTSPAEGVGRPYNQGPMYPGYPQPYDQYVIPFPPSTHFPIPQHMHPASSYPRGILMPSQWTAVPPAYENV